MSDETKSELRAALAEIYLLGRASGMAQVRAELAEAQEAMLLAAGRGKGRNDDSARDFRAQIRNYDAHIASAVDALLKRIEGRTSC